MKYIENDFTNSICDYIDSGKWTKKNYVESYNCLLDSVFVPDMTDRQQPKTMQQRLRDEVEEEHWWDEPITRYDDWYIPEGMC